MGGLSVGLFTRDVCVGTPVRGDVPLETESGWSGPSWTLLGGSRLSGSTVLPVGRALTGVTSTQAEGSPQTLCFGPGIRTPFLGRWTHAFVHTFVAWESLGSHEELESQLVDSSCW